MSLGTKLVQAVQKEAAMKRPLPLLATVSEELHGCGRVVAEVTLTDNDRFSHMTNEVKVRIHRTGKASGGNRASKLADAPTTAERMVERATYLTETLQFVETDAGGQAIVRSSPSSMRGNRAPYFEATIEQDVVGLRRYQPNPHRPGREAIPFCLTDEVMGRLVDDAADVLSGKLRK